MNNSIVSKNLFDTIAITSQEKV